MKKGFTLMEILISISIIAVLTAVGIVSYVSINKNARDAKRQGDIEQIRSALELFRSDIGNYPNTGTGSWTEASNLASSLVDTYIPALPSDPKGAGTPYMYKATNVSGTTGLYYGYCLSAALENASFSNSICDPKPSEEYIYGTKNP